MHFTPAWLFATLFSSSVGYGVFHYGKRETRGPQILAGLALMIVPPFLGSALWVYAASLALLGGLWLATRAGL